MELHQHPHRVRLLRQAGKARRDQQQRHPAKDLRLGRRRQAARRLPEGPRHRHHRRLNPPRPRIQISVTPNLLLSSPDLIPCIPCTLWS